MRNHLYPFFIKEQVIKSIRDFFSTRSFHEVISPVLNPALPFEPTLYAFETVWKTNKGDKKLYLSTSPEAYLKKMMAAGIGNCFSFGKSFRNLEDSGPLHNPEFLMLEWYRENADYRKIMEETKELLGFINVKCQMSNVKTKCINIKNWVEFSLVDLFQKYAGADLEKICHRDDIYNVANKKGYKSQNASWEQLFNQIFLNEIEPKLPQRDPFFLTDFPARISPLCKPRQDKPYLAERFEVYMGGIELGNGNTENTDTKSILKIFRAEEKRRKEKGEICPPVEMDFIEALKKMQGKSYAGIGLGVDRLVMILGNINNIKLLY